MTVTANTDFVDQIEGLPPLSTIVHHVMAMTNSGDTSAADIADVLSEDQAVTAKILRVANSSFFGTGRSITQVSRAVMMLGLIGVRVLGLDEAAIVRIVHALNRRVKQAVEMFASVDTAQARLEPPPEKQAVWVSSGGVDRRSISRLLLEQHGYEVVRTPRGAADDLPPADLTFVELSDEEESVRFAAELAGRGRRGVVVLADPSDGDALRRCDEDTRLYSIPRLFTAFDVDWLEGEIG